MLSLFPACIASFLSIKQHISLIKSLKCISDSNSLIASVLLAAAAAVSMQQPAAPSSEYYIRGRNAQYFVLLFCHSSVLSELLSHRKRLVVRLSSCHCSCTPAQESDIRSAAYSSSLGGETMQEAVNWENHFHLTLRLYPLIQHLL